MGTKVTGEPVTLRREMESAGVDIKCLATEETIAEDLLLWLVIGAILMEGEGAGEVVTTGEVAGVEDLGREGEEGVEGIEVDQGLVQVGTLGIGGQVREEAMEVKERGLVQVEVSTDKVMSSIHHAHLITGKDLGLQDLQEHQLPPPLTRVQLTWGPILETWVPLPKTMLRLCPSFRLAWVAVVGQVAEEGCLRWRISMLTGKKTAW